MSDHITDPAQEPIPEPEVTPMPILMAPYDPAPEVIASAEPVMMGTIEPVPNAPMMLADETAGPALKAEPEPLFPHHIRFEIGETTELEAWVKSWFAWAKSQL